MWPKLLKEITQEKVNFDVTWDEKVSKLLLPVGVEIGGPEAAAKAPKLWLLVTTMQLVAATDDVWASDCGSLLLCSKLNHPHPPKPANIPILPLNMDVIQMNSNQYCTSAAPHVDSNRCITPGLESWLDGAVPRGVFSSNHKSSPPNHQNLHFSHSYFWMDSHIFHISIPRDTIS